MVYSFFWLTISLHLSIVSSFLFDSSNLMALPCRGVLLCNDFIAREQFRQVTRVFARRVAVVKSTPTSKIDNGDVPIGDPSRSDKALSSLPCNLKKWFDISLPEGRCIGVSTANETDCFPQDFSDESTAIQRNHWLRSILHQEEIEFGTTLKKTRNSFWLGRLALRMALDFPGYPILRDKYGRPQLKEDMFCSVSHKPDKGVAIISSPRKDDRNSHIVLSGVGIDLEVTSRKGRPSIAKRILTANERESMGNLPGITFDEEVLLRFSLKEAIYKAAHPLLRQHVGFQEAEVTPYPDGTASCTWFLDTNANHRISKLTAHWKRIDNNNYFLTSASVYTKSKEDIIDLVDK